MHSIKVRTGGDLASASQRDLINYLLEVGAIGQEGANEIIGRYSTEDPFLTYWVRRYPDKGKELTEHLRFCYAWDGIIRKRINGDLNDFLTRALFWVDGFPGVETVSIRSISPHQLPLVNTTLGDHLHDYLREVEINGFDPWEPVKQRDCNAPCAGNTHFEAYDDGRVPAEVCRLMWESYDAAVRYLCAYILSDLDEQTIDGRVKDLSRLLTIFHGGNIPIGFTAQGMLVLIVA